jgi:hypothetical protein
VSRLPWTLWAFSQALAVPGSVLVALHGNSILESSFVAHVQVRGDGAEAEDVLIHVAVPLSYGDE